MIPKSIKLVFPSVGSTNYDRIGVIKAVRALTGMGLKESKDMTEEAGEHVIRVSISDGVDFYSGQTVSAADRYKLAIENLRLNGVRVNENSLRSKMVEDVRRLASEAVLRDENDLAVALIEVVRRFG